MNQSRTSSTTDPAAAALISLTRLLEQVTSRINALPYTLLCAAALIAAITVNGLWTTPALDAVWLIAADITQDPFPSTADADWLLSSWLTPALAWLAGATTTPRMFALFCGGLLAACYAAMCVMFRFRVGEPTARILVLVLVTSPLATVLLTWIGYGDPLSVTLASAILLLPGGEDVKALRRGWSLPEPWGTWSEQPAASLRVRLPPEAALTGALDAVVTAFLGNSGNPQVVEVSVDGRPVTTWTLTQGEATSHPIPVPEEAARNGDPISIDFHIPTARSPASENVSGDPRKLGFGLVAIRVLNGGQP